MHALDKLDIAVVVVFVGDIVGGVVVVCAEINHYNVRSWVLREVPERRIGAIDVSCSPAGIRRPVPLIRLSARVSPAFLVRDADSGVSSDRIFCIAEAGG